MIGNLVLELTLYRVTDKVKRTATELLRDIEGAYRRNEYHSHTRDDSGARQRENNLSERGKAVSSEVGGSFDITLVDLNE